MERRFTQADMKTAVEDLFKDGQVKNMQFMTSMENEGPRFSGVFVKMNDGRETMFNSDDIDSIMTEYVRGQGYGEGLEGSDVTYNMGVRTIVNKDGDKTQIPVFRGCEVELYAVEKDMEQDTKPDRMGPVHVLADMRRAQLMESLAESRDRGLLETVRAHYASHPCLPGEKAVKDMVNDYLDNPDDYPFGLDVYTRNDLIQSYAQTCIRETKIDTSDYEFSPSDLQRQRVLTFGPTQNRNSEITVDRVDVDLMKAPDGNVYVEAPFADCSYTIGRLPENFNRNNPMNVESCKAELQLVDHSNGKGKNVSMRLVANTDLMSGDVLDLNDDMLAGLEQDTGLHQ